LVFGPKIRNSSFGKKNPTVNKVPKCWKIKLLNVREFGLASRSTHSLAASGVNSADQCYSLLQSLFVRLKISRQKHQKFVPRNGLCSFFLKWRRPNVIDGVGGL